MGQVIFDSFSGAAANLTAHAPDVNVPTGAYVDFNFVPALKTDGAGLCISATGTAGFIGGDVLQNTVGVSDAIFGIDVTVPNQASVGTYKMSAGVIIRLQTGAGGGNFWYVAIENDNNLINGYYVRLLLVTGGAVVVDQRLASGLSLNNSTHTLTVQALGNVYTVSLDGSPYTPYTDVSNTYLTAKACGPAIVNGGGYSPATLQNLTVNTVTLVINQTTLPAGKLYATYLQTITSTGGYQPTVTYAVSSGALPSGLTLNASTGVLSGAPTVGGNFFFTITASDTLFDSASQAFTLNVAGKPFLVSPDPRAEGRTRRFEQGVAAILNSLSLGGYLQMTTGGGFKVGGIAIGDVVTGGHYVAGTGGDVLFVGQGPVLAQDDNFYYLPTSAGGPSLTVNAGQINAPGGTVSATDVDVDTAIRCGGFINLSTAVGETGFFEGFIDSAAPNNSAVVVWLADFGSPNYPGHIFGLGTSAIGYTPSAVLGIQASGGIAGLGVSFGSANYYLVGLSTAGGTPYNFSFDASGNLACGSGTITSASASALAVGRQGATNPVLQVDASTANVVTGVAIKGTAASATITATSSGATCALSIDAKGAGALNLAANTAGSVNLATGGGNVNALAGGSVQMVLTAAFATAFAVGRQGATNPAFQVDSSAANSLTGVKVTSATAGSGAALIAISSATNEGLTVDAKGTGTLKLGTKTNQPTTIGTSSVTVTCAGTFAVNIIQTNTASGVAVQGTSTNDSATASFMGEFVSSAIASGAAVALTSLTAKNVTSISLTAGDWDVEGNVNFTTAAATFTATQGGISSTSATLPTDGTEVYSGLLGTLVSDTDSVTLPRKRISIASTTTVYLVAQMTFSAGSASAFGSISARRVR